MENAKKTIIESIPDFLDYCEVELGLSDNTQKNYSRYLHKFEKWLKSRGKQNLAPHELTSEDIWNYRLFLSRTPDENGKLLSKITQNYYLIALRSLLSYFTAKYLLPLPADKITLPKDAGNERNIKFLNLEQIEKLLVAP